MSVRLNDPAYEEHRVTNVDPQEGGGWLLGMDGMCFFCPPESPVEPKPGMAARLYGRGFGFPVRGLVLDGTEVFYQTVAQHEAKMKREAEERDREKRYDFEKNRAAFDRRYRALPEVFQRRLDKFRGNNPDFRWQFESYEMFCCEQAVLIANAALVLAGAEWAKRAGGIKCKDAKAWAGEWVRKFNDMPIDEQKAAVPEVAYGDHSGNTFGCACRLAFLYLTQPEGVVQLHGALAPLVGSEEYGCVPRKAK